MGSPEKCRLTIPHKRWLETGDPRLVVENWMAVEDWVRRLLSDDGCRPCAGVPE